MVHHIPRLCDEQNLPKLVKSIIVGSSVAETNERGSVWEDSMNDVEHLLVFMEKPKVRMVMPCLVLMFVLSIRV